jgi:hypothetical protein
MIGVITDVQDELAIVNAVCNTASDASDETREAALQWLLAQHHEEVSMLVCDLRVESMCFLVECFLFAFSFIHSTLVRFEISLFCQLNRHACHREVIAAIRNLLPQPIAEEIELHIASLRK